MQPSKKFGKIMRVVRISAKICGADPLDPNYKLNIITYLVLICITLYFIFSAYTVHLKFHEGWGVILQTFCMVGSVFQGISKLLMSIVKVNSFISNTNLLKSIYEKFETKGEKYAKALNKCISRTESAFKVVLGMYSTGVIYVIVHPVVTWVLTGRELFPMQFFLPKIDTATAFGYFATVGVQSTCFIFGAFGNFAGDMYMLVFFTHCSIFVDILKLKIKELNELTADFGNPATMEMLLGVLKWHQTYSNYIEETDRCYFWVNFTQITTSALSMVLTLFIMFTGDWLGSYVYLFVSLAILYIYCGMGTFAELSNDDVSDEIYNIHWYNMTITQQKIVGFMLMRSQVAKEVTVGGVAPLSVSTGLQVTKTVYSVFMMLLNFFT